MHVAHDSSSFCTFKDTQSKSAFSAGCVSRSVLKSPAVKCWFTCWFEVQELRAALEDCRIPECCSGHRGQRAVRLISTVVPGSWRIYGLTPAAAWSHTCFYTGANRDCTLLPRRTCVCVLAQSVSAPCICEQRLLIKPQLRLQTLPIAHLF